MQNFGCYYSILQNSLCKWKFWDQKCICTFCTAWTIRLASSNFRSMWKSSIGFWDATTLLLLVRFAKFFHQVKTFNVPFQMSPFMPSRLPRWAGQGDFWPTPYVYMIRRKAEEIMHFPSLDSFSLLLPHARFLFFLIRGPPTTVVGLGGPPGAFDLSLFLSVPNKHLNMSISVRLDNATMFRVEAPAAN